MEAMEKFAPLLKRSEGFEALKRDIIEKGYCTNCGACASFCHHIVMKDLPELDSDCSLGGDVIKCSDNGTCYDICPMTKTDIKALEEGYLEGTPEENLGVVKEIHAVKTDTKGQDGGVVTTLLMKGIESGLFDSAIVAVKGSDFQASPLIAETTDDVKKASGTKYVATPMVEKIGEAIRSGKRKIAFVGTPCQIRAARTMQDVMLKNVPQVELTLIGLFCMESFDYDKLKSKASELMNVNVDEADKLDITKGKFIVTKGGEEASVKVGELDDAVRNNCHYCEDFASELADISVGSVGSPAGFSTVLVRSSKGKELFETLKGASEDSVSKEGLTKVASIKKTKAEGKKEGDVPPILG
ncbi:MAG: Coenzyme F420 hydrogenase/dehydrogenase, beta subunit C-terminal domain [Halobacteriota archaeon]|nr:Coenzyme F420 hydrogenase/dehydrogenase, beta subunit C-terminal domain [Halobacteriota archaeon]